MTRIPCQYKVGHAFSRTEGGDRQNAIDRWACCIARQCSILEGLGHLSSGHVGTGRHGMSAKRQALPIG